MSKGLGRTQIEVMEAIRRLQIKVSGRHVEPWRIANEIRAMRGLPDRAEKKRQNEADQQRSETKLKAQLKNGTAAERKEAERILALRAAVAGIAANYGNSHRAVDRGFSESVGLSRILAKLEQRGMVDKIGGRGAAWVSLTDEGRAWLAAQEAA
jgi:hypothetical protein